MIYEERSDLQSLIDCEPFRLPAPEIEVNQCILESYEKLTSLMELCGHYFNISTAVKHVFKSEVNSAQLHFFFQVPKSCTDLDQTLLFIWILRTYSRFVRKNKMLAHGICFPHPCPSAGRRLAASRSGLDHYLSFPKKLIRLNAL